MFGVQFCRFGSMVCRVVAMTRRSVRVMRGLQVIAGFVVPRGLAMMPRGMLMVFSGFLVVFCGFPRHRSSLQMRRFGWAEGIKRGSLVSTRDCSSMKVWCE
jgi:hypothetical protein